MFELVPAGVHSAGRQAVEHEGVVGIGGMSELNLLFFRHARSLCVKTSLDEKSEEYTGPGGWRRGGGTAFEAVFMTQS